MPSPLAALADLNRRMGADCVLAQASLSDGTLDTDKVNQALADASAEVEGYLAGRYLLPLQNVPEIVVRICCDMAWFYLHGVLPPQSVKDKFERAKELLSAINKGNINLGLDTTGSPMQNTDAAEMVSQPVVWRRERFGGFI